MNEKIIQIGSAITNYVLNSFEPDYLHLVFGGVIDVDDLVDQVILECIKKAFDATEEKFDEILWRLSYGCILYCLWLMI